MSSARPPAVWNAASASDNGTIAITPASDLAIIVHPRESPNAPWPTSGDSRSLRFEIDRVERLARGHEQAVPLRAAEADVRAVLRQPDHADRLAGRRDDQHAGARARPDVAVDVAADAVGERRRAGGAGHRQLREALPVARAL